MKIDRFGRYIVAIPTRKFIAKKKLTSEGHQLCHYALVQ